MALLFTEKIKDYYENLQSEIRTQKLFREDLLNKNEEYHTLTSRRGELSFTLAKLSYAGNDTSTLEKEIEMLDRKIAKFCDKFYKNNKISYKCKECFDTGYTNGEKCKCHKKYLAKLCVESLDITGYTPINLQKLTPPSGLEKYYKTIFTYAEKFPNTKLKNIIISGNTGAGKTYLTSALCQTISEKGYSTIFLTSTELNNIFIKMHINDSDKKDYFDILSTCDLLVIDDLGTEPIYQNVTIEYLNALISERLKIDKHFIITTNLNSLEIKNRYSGRFFSRVFDKDKSIYYEFLTKDLRINK